MMKAGRKVIGCLLFTAVLSLSACAKEPPSTDDLLQQYLDSNPNAYAEAEAAASEAAEKERKGSNTSDSSGSESGSQTTSEASEEVSQIEFDETMKSTILYDFMTRYDKDSDVYVQVDKSGGFVITYIKSGDKLYYNINTGHGSSTELYEGTTKYVLNDSMKSYVKVENDARRVPENFFKTYLNINKYAQYKPTNTVGSMETFEIYGGQATFEFSDEVKKGDAVKYQTVSITDNSLFSITERDITDDDKKLLELPSDYKQA